MRHALLPSLLVVVSLLVTAAPVAAVPDGWTSDLAAARQEARKGDRLILVDLWAEWCGWCKVLEREVFGTETFQTRMADFLKVQLDSEDGATGTDLQEKFAAHILPTTLILSADLVEVGRVEGFAPLDDFIGQVEEAVTGYRRLLDRYQTTLAQGGNPGAVEGLAVELGSRKDHARAARLLAGLVERSEKPEEKAYYSYRYAEALIDSGKLIEAASTLETSRRLASSLGDRRLLEVLDMLRIRVAEGEGECARAELAAREFLATYPTSRHRGYAEKALATAGETSSCG